MYNARRLTGEVPNFSAAFSKRKSTKPIYGHQPTENIYENLWFLTDKDTYPYNTQAFQVVLTRLGLWNTPCYNHFLLPFLGFPKGGQTDGMLIF